MSTIDHQSEAALAGGTESVACVGARFSNSMLPGALFVFVVAFLGWMAWKTWSVRPRSLTDTENETFRTAQTHGDMAFQESRPGKSDGKLTIAPPPVAAPVVAPPPRSS